MTFEILNTMRKNQNIVVEAEVGIGKSFAYLLPMILYNKKSIKPVIIATSSIALQEQLINDINTLSELLHSNTNVILAKGKRNYACLHKCRLVFKESSLIGDGTNKFLEMVESGLVDKALLPEIPSEIWDKINATNCQYKRCIIHRKCKFIELRNEFKEFSGIIITNQDMIINDLKKKENNDKEIFTNEVKFLVIDEGHNLEEKVRNSYTNSWSKNSLKSDILRMGDDFGDDFKSQSNYEEHIIKLIDLIFEQLNRDINHQINKNDDTDKYYINVENILEYLVKLKLRLDELTDRFKDNNYGSIRSMKKKINSIREFYSLIEDLINKDTQYVKWLCRQDNTDNSITIERCPSNISQVIGGLFFEDKNFKTIMTSATLTHNNSMNNEKRYEYFISNYNYPVVNENSLSTPKESPFLYNKKTIIYASEKLPIYKENEEGFINSSISEIVELLRITNGRSLILFTSKKDMRSVYQKLSDLRLPWEILMQQTGSSQGEILDKFKMNKNSVLLGTGLFWEGISIEGESLSCVLIYRLPFPVPDPIISHKCSISSNEMSDVLLPIMIIKLKQGIGRLIRNSSDYGLVAILDPRLSRHSRKTYKNQVWEALPIKGVVYNLDELRIKYNRISRKYSKRVGVFIRIKAFINNFAKR